MESNNSVIKLYRENPSLVSIGKVFRDTGKLITVNKEVVTGNGVEKVPKRIPVKEDTRTFIKFFEGDNIGDWTKLSLTAQRVLRFILRKLELDKCYVIVYGSEFCREYGMSRQSFSLGIKELLVKNWIYRSEEPKMYWINLYYICKGNVEDMWYKYQETIPI